MITLRRGTVSLSGLSAALREYEPLEITIRADPADPGLPTLTLDGAPLDPGPRVARDAAGLVFTWTFRPECWCGRIQLQAAQGAIRTAIEVVVSPDPGKLSAQDYDSMLDRVLAHDRSLAWGLAPGEQKAALSDGNVIGVLHPVIAAHVLPDLMRQLGRIVESPVLTQRPIERIVGLRAGMPLNSSERRSLKARPDLRQRLRTGDPTLTMLRHRREHSLDHPANRWVVGALGRVRRALLLTEMALQKACPGLDALERARAITLAQQTRNTAETIASVLARSDFVGLAPGELSDSAALVVAGHPAYARFHRLVRRLLGASLRLDRDGALAACLRRTWDLFELDCLFTLVIGLEAGLTPGWSFQRKATRYSLLAGMPDGEIWRAQDGQGARWTLHNQQTFRGHSDGPGSISSRRRPDFVLSRWQGDALLRWVLLDAKYRVGWRGMTDAIAEMHVYRDSLRWHHEGKALAADGGYLLVPEIGFGSRRFAEPAYRTAHRFGVVRRDDTSFISFLLGTDAVGMTAPGRSNAISVPS